MNKEESWSFKVPGSTETPLVSRAASTITKSLLAQVCSIVASCSARAVLVYADVLRAFES